MRQQQQQQTNPRAIQSCFILFLLLTSPTSWKAVICMFCFLNSGYYSCSGQPGSCFHFILLFLMNILYERVAYCAQYIIFPSWVPVNPIATQLIWMPYLNFLYWSNLREWEVEIFWFNYLKLLNSTKWIFNSIFF